MIQDPAGLLERIPELLPLCEDPRVKKAVEGGDPFKVYRALVRAKWLGGLKAHRQTLRALLSRRRLFAKPHQGKLVLATFNSFGATLVGGAERDPVDGTWIATHAIVAFFILPLFPLGAYVVADGQKKGLRSSWRIFAKVPLGTFSWLYSRGIALALLLAVGFAGLSAFHASRNQVLQIVSAFDVPIRVAFGARSVTVPPKGRASLELPKGPQHGTATAPKGLLVDELKLEVKPGADLLAWNLAGAAPLYRVRIAYRSDDASPPPEKPTVYCGQKLIALDDVDVAFQAPPQTVSMPEGVDVVYRTLVEVDTRHGEPLPLCLNYLLQTNQVERTLPALEAAAALSGWAPAQTGLALNLAMVIDPQVELRIAKQALDAHPDDLDTERVYQNAMEEAGRGEEMRRVYQAAAKAAPDSARAQYLAARLLSGHANWQRAEALAARFPKDDVLLRSLVYARYTQTHWREAAEAWRALRGRNPALASEVAEQGIISLFASGAHAEALAAAEGLVRDGPKDRRAEAAALYARVAQRMAKEAPPALEPAKWVRTLEEEAPAPKGKPGAESGRNWALRARAGLPLDGAPNEEVKLALALRQDPAKAVQSARSLQALDLLNLPQLSWALLYGEALRTADARAVAVLKRAPALRPEAREAFERYVRGEKVDLGDTDVPPGVRAAACVVRARNPALTPVERARLLEQAGRLAPLAPEISAATRTWKL